MDPLHDRRFFAVVISSMDSMRLWDSDFDLYCYPCFCWQNLNMAHYCNQKTLMWTIISCTTGHFWVDEYLFPQGGYVIGSQEGSHERWEFLAWTQRMSTPSLPSSKIISRYFHWFCTIEFQRDFQATLILRHLFWGCFRSLEEYWHVVLTCVYTPLYTCRKAFVHYQSSSVTGPLCLRRLWSLPWCWPALLGRMKGWVNILHLLVSFW